MSVGTSILLGIIRSPAGRYKVWKWAEKQMTKYEWGKCTHIKSITSQFHELMTAFPKEWFGDRKEPFEDIIASVPLEAEKYCKAMYGNYMKLPPEDKRMIRHNTIAIDLHHPYTEYRGKLYCVGTKSALPE
jgi:LPS biosynthesis protein